MKHGKNYSDSVKAFDLTKTYEASEAVGIVLDTAKAKFDETIELHVRLGVDPRQADQQVRGVLVLPHGTGKTKKVLRARITSARKSSSRKSRTKTGSIST